MLTQIADMSGAFCGFGHVDINDAEEIVFEAQVIGGLDGCGDAFSTWDGLYRGGNPSTDGVVTLGDIRLDDHQYYDSAVLGELNENSQVSFLTTYSEPLVDGYIVWRTDLERFGGRIYIEAIDKLIGEGLHHEWRHAFRIATARSAPGLGGVRRRRRGHDRDSTRPDPGWR